MNMQDEKYLQKSKSISSAEPNYFVHFAMRYPVIGVVGRDNVFSKILGCAPLCSKSVVMLSKIVHMILLL